jgi:hypothetical protein
VGDDYAGILKGVKPEPTVEVPVVKKPAFRSEQEILAEMNRQQYKLLGDAVRAASGKPTTRPGTSKDGSILAVLAVLGMAGMVALPIGLYVYDQHTKKAEKQAEQQLAQIQERAGYIVSTAPTAQMTVRSGDSGIEIYMNGGEWKNTGWVRLRGDDE